MHLTPPRPFGVRCASGALGLLTFLISALLSDSQTRGDDYVLLQNGNVIRGTAVSIGPMVVIRHGQGNELKLDARQVAYTAATLRELYEFRIASRRIQDVSSCHDDARWCFRNALYAEMAESLEAARRFDPSHPETLRLHRQLQVKLEASAKPPMRLPSQDEAAESASGGTALPAAVRDQPLQKSDEELMHLNLSSDALMHFTSRVQPILVNRCGNSGCHRSPTEAKWQLTHMGVQVRPPARMTRLNLAATLEWIDAAQPENSDLLRYAVQPHGGRREPPLRPTDELALEALRQWAQTAFNSHPSQQWAPLTPFVDMPSDATAVVPVAPNRPLATAGAPVQQVGFVDDEAIGQEPVPPVPPAPQSIRPITTGAAARPTRLPPVDNPFDPEIFNRHYRQQGGGDR